MTLTLEMRPQDSPKSWHAFIGEAPPYAIAVDGYVIGGPKFDPNGPWANFNHHEEVDRLSTRATCAQVLMAIRQGLFRRFRNNDGVQMKVYANDCDEDVCTTWFLLKNHHISESTMNPALNRLVHLEDMFDTTAGAYPFPADLPALKALAWVFEPYRRARLTGILDRRDPSTFLGIVTDVENRIMRYVIGEGDEIALDTRYEKLGGGHQWALIREIGGQAKTGAFADGIYAYVSVRDRPDGRFTYTIGRMSPFIMFDVPKLINILNQHEETVESLDRWGGGDTIGGSPRVNGSKLTPETLEKIINENL